MRRARIPSLGLILLVTELFQASTSHGLPPITLSIIVGQILIYLRVFALPWTSTTQACLSVHKILYYKDYWKLLYSQIEHGDDWHLYYNMTSFMWKGRSLEKRMGSSKYSILLVIFTAATALTYVLLQYALAEVLEEPSYMYRCAVGFSGVIFALKVLTTHYDSEHQSRGPLGISINSKYVVWVELIFISLITPNASFVGHLAGILVGLGYVYGPLKPLVDLLHRLLFNPWGGYTDSYTGSSRRFAATSQSTGYRSSNNQRPPQQQSSSHIPNPKTRMTEEEQIRRATANSLVDNLVTGRGTANLQSTAASTSQMESHPPHTNTELSPEELRRRRINFFL